MKERINIYAIECLEHSSRILGGISNTNPEMVAAFKARFAGRQDIIFARY